MPCLEIITIRSHAGEPCAALQELLRQVPAIAHTPGLRRLRIFRNATVEGDAGIHLEWDSPPGAACAKSAQGLGLAQVLRRLGLVSHAVWIETETEPGA